MAFNVDWSQVFEPKWLKTHTQTSWMPIVLGTVTCSPFRIIDQWMVKSSAKRSSSESHWSKITLAFLCSLTFRAELKTKDLGFIVFVIVSDITHRVCYKPAFTKHLNLHWPSTSKKRPLRGTKKSKDPLLSDNIFFAKRICSPLFGQQQFDSILTARETSDNKTIFIA